MYGLGNRGIKAIKLWLDWPDLRKNGSEDIRPLNASGIDFGPYFKGSLKPGRYEGIVRKRAWCSSDNMIMFIDVSITGAGMDREDHKIALFVFKSSGYSSRHEKADLSRIPIDGRKVYFEVESSPSGRMTLISMRV